MRDSLSRFQRAAIKRLQTDVGHRTIHSDLIERHLTKKIVAAHPSAEELDALFDRYSDEGERMIEVGFDATGRAMLSAASRARTAIYEERRR